MRIFENFPAKMAKFSLSKRLKKTHVDDLHIIHLCKCCKKYIFSLRTFSLLRNLAIQCIHLILVPFTGAPCQ